MKISSIFAWPLVLGLAVAACNDTPTQPDGPPVLAVAKGTTVVTTLAEWQEAIATVKKGGQILIQGTIDIPGGEEAYLEVPNVTIGAATPGSGLRSVANATGSGPECLVCLGAAADRATVEGLTLDASISGIPMQAWVSVTSGEQLVGVTFRDNYSICDGTCDVHVFFNNAPNATFADNVLMGQPAFSAIQIQISTGVRVIDNWVEHGGRAGGIRIRGASDEPLVVDNTIASAPGFNGIHMAARGGTFRDNKILAITDPDAPSCIDLTTGTKTAGTANTWIDNQAPVPSSPVGICGPIP